ncbi:hypothetical protein CPB84DRAFT_1671255, partial [Gymnopilus junonius]
IAGIATALALKRKLKFTNFTIYERADAVGGTWRDNTYPGCGSDVPGHWYSLSTDLNPYWQNYYANQPELRAYWERLWRDNSLVRHTVFGTCVTFAAWNNETQRYSIELENVRTGEKKQVEAEILFWAIGGFQAPLYPKDVTGMDNFKGEMWHSARWQHDVDLRKKRVGVIGNGCSAAQLIPEITKDPSVNVINFCRTPQWYIPRACVNFQYPRWLQWIFAHLPLLLRFYRNLIMARSDLSFLIFRKDNEWLIKLAKKDLTAYIKKMAPERELKNLIPTPGCKRIIVDSGYLQSLKQSNVCLRWDTIDSIVENGIKMKSGEVIPLDVIIFSTGYSVEAEHLKVRGSKGVTIDEYFASKGGPYAYLGSCIPGFPNQFLLLGPNVASGHASIIFSEEAQINFALQLIQPVLEGKVKSFEISEDATVKYNDWLQKRLQSSVWTDCVSYYQAGRKSKTRIVATFPGPVALFWWFCRGPKWELFHGEGGERWEKERKMRKMRRWAWMTALVIVVGYLVR